MLDWLLHKLQATPTGRIGRRKHLSSVRDKTDTVIIRFLCNIDLMSTCGNVSHHLAKHYDFWSQLFVNGEDVNEAESEDHVVNTHEIPTKFKSHIKHPKNRSKYTVVTAPPGGQLVK